MKLRIAVAALLPGVLAMCLAGCGGGDGGGATVAGRVVDDGTLQPLARATAKIGGATSRRTSADGRFTVTGAPTGGQTLVVTVGGHDTLRRAVTLTGGNNNVGDCHLAPYLQPAKGAITGRTVAAGGGAIGGARIRTDTAEAVSRSDGSGRFTLYNVPAGVARVDFRDPVTSATAWPYVTVTAGPPAVDIGDVVLSIGPPPPP